MKLLKTTVAVSITAVLAGCATSSQVQEMIDASHRDYQQQLETNQNSIAVLKQSAMTGLEKSSDNATRLDSLEKQVADLAHQMVVAQDLANASKVISAANTVKVSNLEDQFTIHEEQSARDISRMTDIDELYEKVLIRQFQDIADSADAAIAALKVDGYSASTNAPVKLDTPIVIVAPDTTAPTNSSESGE